MKLDPKFGRAYLGTYLGKFFNYIVNKLKGFKMKYFIFMIFLSSCCGQVSCIKSCSNGFCELDQNGDTIRISETYLGNSKRIYCENNQASN